MYVDIVIRYSLFCRFHILIKKLSKNIQLFQFVRGFFFDKSFETLEVAVALPAEQKTGAFSACRVWPQILRASKKEKKKQHIICS